MPGGDANLSLRNEFKRQKFGFSNCTASRFYKLQWTSIEIILYAYRSFLVVYCLSWLIVDLRVAYKYHYFFYATNWAQIVTLLYFVSALCVSLIPCYHRYLGQRSTTNVSSSLKWYHKMTWVLLNINVTIAVVTSIVYWFGVSQGLVDQSEAPLSVSIHVHIFLALLSVIEVLINDLPIRILHFYWPVALSFIYVVFSLILHWCGTISNIYEILDWDQNPGMAGGISFALVFVFTPLVHFMVSYGCYRLRIFLWKGWKSYLHKLHQLEVIV